MGGKERTQTSPGKAAKGARAGQAGQTGQKKTARAASAPDKAGKAPRASKADTGRAAKVAQAGKPTKVTKAGKTGKTGKTGKEKTPAAPGASKAKARPKQAAARRALDLPRMIELLAQTYDQARVELDHESAYELLVATILAAQSTDRRINLVTPALFARYPNARSLAGADQAELEEQIRSTGFFRMKAKHLLGMARTVVERHDGEIPRTMDELCALPGVARKTANVVLGNFFGIPAGIVVDTHVTRLARRLGLTSETDPEKIERDLMALIPRDQWISFADRLIWHGRRVCFARQPACDICPLAPLCPSAGIGARAIPADDAAPEPPDDAE